jgi:beta-mannosidase
MQPLTPLSLDGDWALYAFPQGAFPCAHPDDLAGCGLTPIPALVPGNVELDLVRAGLLPDPFIGRNIDLLREFEDYEWWYLRDFDLPASAKPGDWELVFEGLDTLAEVWVNGCKIGQSANMLVPHRFPLGDVLATSPRNRIAVRLSSALLHARAQHYTPWEMSWEQRWEGLRLRKAPHVWGWDIMPRAVSAGIWRSVRLAPILADNLDWLYVWTRSANPHMAVLGVRFQVSTTGPLDGLHLQFSGACGEHILTYDWPLEFNAGGCNISIPNPRLWWPAGYGSADLYTLRTRLYRGDELLAERIERVGLRTLTVETTPTAGLPEEREALPGSPERWDRDPDPHHHFLIRVNGQPVMVKGTNWVPLDAFHSRDAGRLERAVNLAVEAGCNMIRCWGGNVYESDAFFDLCDQNGILVWQDLAFACCAYPQDDDFQEVVKQEAQKTVIRLRNHACLALWCGDNENDFLYASESLDPGANRLTRETIPSVLRRFDPHRVYLPSSPYLSPEGVRENAAPPEQHLWGPRGYYKSPFYTRHSAHFIGEIGYHGCPEPRTLERFLSPAELWPWQDNPAWQTHAVYHWRHHAIERDRIKLMVNQIREMFGSIPETLADFALASQITQAEAKKFFIESTRLRKWQTSGILWWNLIDGWPQFSDAVVDYFFTPKLAYHYIRRAQLALGLMVGEAGSGKYLPLIACNDTLQDLPIAFRAWDALSGEIVAQGENIIPANQNWQVARIRSFASDQRLLLLQWESAGRVYGSHYLCGTPPFRLDDYRIFLPLIAALPTAFEVPVFQTERHL